MELDELKAAWNNMETPANTPEEIKLMLQENRHPVLKEIRKQLAIEITGWSIFLAVYYTMFDGDKKPLLINVILVITVLLPLIHNLMGYRFSKYLVNGATIRQSLENYLSKVRVYAIVSVMSRVFFMTGLLVFLLYGLNFNSAKYISLAVIISFFLVQTVLLSLLWTKRLKKLGNVLTAFN